MVGSVAASTSAFFSAFSSSFSSLRSRHIKGPENLDAQVLVAKYAPDSVGLHAKLSIKAVVNGVITDTSEAEHWEQNFPDSVGLGKMVEKGLVYRQHFPIRSYEVGPDQTACIESIMNHLQDTSLNHAKRVRILADGFGCTAEMARRNLIWVITKMQLLIEHYPSWGDVIQVDTSIGESGKNGMRRDWHFQDCLTGQTVLRATRLVINYENLKDACPFTCKYVMMNKSTRRLSKFPKEVIAEIEPLFMEELGAVIDADNRKLLKLDKDTADHVCRGLTPRWKDLDANQHVNNVKYIGWILESVPISIQESHEISSMTLEYRRECGRNSMVESLTTVTTDRTNGSMSLPIECHHLLRCEDGSDILKGRTEWKPKRGTRSQVECPEK